MVLELEILRQQEMKSIVRAPSSSFSFRSGT